MIDRFFDICFSGFALILLSPLIIPIVLVLKFSGEGEIFFMQERIGRGGRAFNLIKFATMLKDSPNMGTGTLTMKEDPRILPVGKFLRKTKINELPQLINVLLGNMSIIGPRPLTIQAFNSYSKSTQSVIKKIRPGLSGIGSIIFRNEEEIMSGSKASVIFYNEVIAPYKGSLEEWFVANKNSYIYFLAIFITVWSVLFPSSRIVWKIFKKLPKPPQELRGVLNYPEYL